MKRRDFIKSLSIPAASLFGLSLLGCGKDGESALKGNAIVNRLANLDNLRVWAYYVPLLSYDGIIEEFEGRNQLDRKIIYSEVIKETSRISGRETDGTGNASLDVDALQASEEYLRVRFWHDDFAKKDGEGHSLYIFKRYLDDLEAGNKVFVATGMYQDHFHVIMIEPQAKKQV